MHLRSSIALAAFAALLTSNAAALRIPLVGGTSKPNVGGNLIVSEPPTYVRPYILRNLDGFAISGGGVTRIFVSNASSGGAFALIGSYGSQASDRVFPHRHPEHAENWFTFKGRVRLWLNNEGRDLWPGDYGHAPTFTNHSLQLMEPDTVCTGIITPGGFEKLWTDTQNWYTSATDAEFAPEAPMTLPGAGQKGAPNLAADDVVVSMQPSNMDIVDGTTNGHPWHTKQNDIPTDPTQAYYIANGWGPQYLVRSLGQVVAPLLTGKQTNGTNTIATVVMRKLLAGETPQTVEFQDHQAFQVLEGELWVEIAGQQEQLGTGDVVFIPGATPFSYWSKVAFTKFFVASAGDALDSWMVRNGEKWAHAIFPDTV